MNLGFEEIVIILVLLLILYGKRLPEITRALGRGLAEIKRSLDEMKQDLTRDEITNPNNKNRADLPELPKPPPNQTASDRDKDKNDTKEDDKSDNSQSPYKENHNLAG